jgi:hypothetical protein
VNCIRKVIGELKAAGVNAMYWHNGPCDIRYRDARPVWHEYHVIAANQFDSSFADSDKLQVHADEMTASIITATVISDDALVAAKFSAGAIEASVDTKIQAASPARDRRQPETKAQRSAAASTSLTARPKQLSPRSSEP